MPFHHLQFAGVSTLDHLLRKGTMLLKNLRVSGLIRCHLVWASDSTVTVENPLRHPRLQSAGVSQRLIDSEAT